ncbi:beta-1,3-galactosyl-O-glycosyl-glycoprotein beta-1,6-N-acetylglucosaminyltransferase-like [Tachysurus ichikawai]
MTSPNKKLSNHYRLLMALINARRRGCKKLLLSRAWLCALFLFISLIVHKKSKVHYRSLMFRNDETPEDECDCNKILQGDPDEIKHAKILTITKNFKNITQITDEQYVKQTEDCETFLRTRKYIPFPMSVEEEAFPVAYSIIVHHKVQNFERLLRSIYSPLNLYCIHVDKKATQSTKKAINAIVSCIENVFLASQIEEVVYASWSRVQADINCMKDLYQVSSRWKYFINLCGQDFPIKTNLEIVHALKALAGANSLETEITPPNKMYRWKKKPPIDKWHNPDNQPRQKSATIWYKDIHSPDELIWATLQRIPGVPGFLRSHPKYDITDIYSISRLIKWAAHEGSLDALYPACQGIHIRNVCVYGVGDLQWILKQRHMFANKFDTDFDPIVIRCLEKYLRHKALKSIIN